MMAFEGWSGLIGVLAQVGIPLVLITLGFTIGRLRERRHWESLARREAQPGPALTNLDALPGGMTPRESFLCNSSVVIASDAFKSFGASLKTLVGGRLRTLETLLDRARREALVRLREQAAAGGADIVLNVRIETTMVMKKSPEVLAYGTAVKLA